MNELVVLYTTWPDAETAETLGRLAVESRLAGCVNVLPPIRSIYRWEGIVNCESETPMLLKTTAGAVERLKDLILKYHPYDTPCILAFRTDPLGCHSGYAEWLGAETAPSP